jgi:hypothetical protein
LAAGGSDPVERKRPANSAAAGLVEPGQRFQSEFRLPRIATRRLDQGFVGCDAGKRQSPPAPPIARHLLIARNAHVPAWVGNEQAYETGLDVNDLLHVFGGSAHGF